MNTNRTQSHIDPRVFQLADEFYPGVIREVNRNTFNHSGCQSHFLSVIVELNAKDKSGQPLIAERAYNFSVNGHGRKFVVRDYQSIVGRDLTSEEIWRFDPSKIQVGLPVTARLDFQRSQYGDSELLPIRSFHQPNETMANLSWD